jgi:hypothetical protein
MYSSEELIARSHPCGEAPVREPLLVELAGGGVPVDVFGCWLKVHHLCSINLVTIETLGII